MACVGLDQRHLGHDLVDAVARTLGLELRFHVGEHAAGDLGGEDAGVHQRGRLELGVLRADLREVVADLAEAVHVEVGGVVGALEHLHEGFGRVVAGAKAHRRDGRVDHVGTRLDGLHEADEGDARGGVAVNVDLDVAVGFLDAADDVVGGLRLEEGGHVLEGDRLGAHVDELPGELHVALDGVDRRDGVADGALGMLADLLDGLHRLGHVAGVVEGVKDTEDVHAVLGRLLDELFHHRVLVVAVAEKVLATQQHLETGIGHQFTERTEPDPRILIEEADTGVEGCTTPTLHGPVTCGIDVCAGVDHVFQGHSGCHQTLVCVPEHQLGDADLSRTHGPYPTMPGQLRGTHPPASAQPHDPALTPR